MQACGFRRSLLRKEDGRLLSGRGRFTGDFDLPRQAHGQVLCAPHAHAEIRAIDASAAHQTPGVFMVLTGAEAMGDGPGLHGGRIYRRLQPDLSQRNERLR